MFKQKINIFISFLKSDIYIKQSFLFFTLLLNIAEGRKVFKDIEIATKSLVDTERPL